MGAFNSSQNVRLLFWHFWASVAESELPISFNTILYNGNQRDLSFAIKIIQIGPFVQIL